MMTQAGLDKLKQELAEALAQRPVISAAIAEAREKGDLSENAEYDAARDAQGLLEVKIARLKEKVANARVIDESKLSADAVQLLSKVKVKNLSNKMVMNFQVVPESEADFSKGLLELKIANLQNTIANAKVIDESMLSADKVQMLTRVKVKNITAGRDMEFTIVGENEADFSKGRLAATTPIARALRGHSKGDTVEAKVPSGVMKFKILDISL